MKLRSRLELRQGQTLVMTPQLQRSIELLALSNLDLMGAVEEELRSNPLLLGPDGEDDGALDAAPEAPDPPAGDEDDGYGGDYGDDDRGGDDGHGTPDGDWATREPARGPAGASGPGFEQNLTRPETLRAHLVAQLSLEIVDPIDRLIGLYLIDMLDDAGYLAGDAEEAAARLDCRPARVAAVLERLRGFDPAGLFARDLADCLALQLADRGRLEGPMAVLIANLDRLAAGDIAGLAGLCGVEPDTLAGMIGEIRTLDPKPAQAFEPEIAATLLPDVLVRAGPAGDWLVELNNDTLPRVLVDRHYHAKIRRGALSREERTYLSDCLQKANWLVKSLDQRARTIVKVASEIVHQQEAFLVHGVQHLKPLILRDIAEAIEMHESTVSRVVTNKYMATPRGIFELRYFFSPALASSTGGAPLAAEAVRERIRRLIEAEDAARPLSDDGLARILRLAGVDIARRTVAKYREALRIPSSVERRRRKKRAAITA